MATLRAQQTITAKKPVKLNCLLFCISYIIFFSSVVLTRYEPNTTSYLLHFYMLTLVLSVSLSGVAMPYAVLVLPFSQPPELISIVVFLCISAIISHVFLLIVFGLLILMHHYAIAFIASAPFAFALFALFCAILVTCNVVLYLMLLPQGENPREKEIGILRQVVDMGDAVTILLYAIGFLLQSVDSISAGAIEESLVFQAMPMHVLITCNYLMQALLLRS